MKVDILTPIRFGGPQKWGDDLVRALKAERIEARNIHNLWGIIQRFFYTDADVIHSTLPLTFNLQGKPIILTIHGNLNIEKHPWSFMWSVAIKRANVITVPSEFLKKELGLKKAIAIPNGIFPEDYKPVKPRKKEVLQIVTVTGFKFWDKARGVIELLKILEEVKRKTKQKFDFTVVGGGPYLNKIKEESRKYDIPVKFIGFHPNPKEILQKSDIFVYYSFQDNLPIAILEAMAYRLATLTNNCGAVRTIIKNNYNGFISLNNPDFVNKLIYLMKNNKTRIRLGKKAMIVFKKFSWNKIIKNFIILYKNE